MKFRNTVICAVLAVSAALCQSCLMGQTDYFDKTASARMNEFIEGARKALLSPESGWSMEYFTDAGGYVYAMKFDNNGEVTVSNEMNPGKSEKSYYKITTDNGPVLSFDTYNSIMHYFATPSSSYYEALGGDFEFIILDYSETEIHLKGKRTGRYATLKSLPSDITVADYTLKMAKIIKDFLILDFDCDFSGNTDYSGRFDLENRLVVFGIYDQDGVVVGEEFSREFVFTETGLRLYDTLAVNGAKFSSFEVDTKTNKVVSDAEGVTITPRPVSDDYYHFDNYPGDYVLKIGSSSYDVRLTVEDEFNRILNLEGIDKKKFNYEIFLYYNVNKGTLSLEAQLIHIGDETCRENEDEEVYVAMLGFNANGSGSPYYSMQGIWNKNKTKPVINFVSGVESATVDGFLLWNYDEDGWGSQYTGRKFFPKELKPFTSLTRK